MMSYCEEVKRSMKIGRSVLRIWSEPWLVICNLVNTFNIS